jgi:hypothetical protein
MSSLHEALTAYEQGRCSGGALCMALRSAARDWPGLPPRFVVVLESLLQPLESSALFSEESCAFSRHDLAAPLRQWLQAAQLKAPQPGAVAASPAAQVRVEQTG